MPTPESAKRFWNIASLSEDEGEIILYGEICSRQPVDWWTGEPEQGLFITPEGFLDDLAQVAGAEHITVRLNSVGGDLYTGIAIHNTLKGLPGKVTVIVEGIAASAASVIACSGDEVQVYPGSIVMIHPVSGFLFGYYNGEELEKVIKGFETCNAAITAIYSEKTGTDENVLRTMLTEETWMTGKEAVDCGFADTLLEGADPELVLSGKEVLFVNGISHNIAGLHVPQYIMKNQTKKPQGGDKPMATTVEELKQEYPQLVALIEEKAAADATVEATAAALQAERERIQEIDSIAASIADPELVEIAKFGDAQSGAAGVEGVPSNETGETNPEEGVAEIVALHRAVKTGGKVK